MMKKLKNFVKNVISKLPLVGLNSAPTTYTFNVPNVVLRSGISSASLIKELAEMQIGEGVSEGLTPLQKQSTLAEALEGKKINRDLLMLVVKLSLARALKIGIEIGKQEEKIEQKIELIANKKEKKNGKSTKSRRLAKG